MNRWETPEERTARFMKIPPVKKMEWLRQMHEFVFQSSTKRMKAIRLKLRDLRS